MAELRYRRGRNRARFRVIAYFTSIIPAALIAFNFEAFRQFVITAFGGQVVEQPQPQQQQQLQAQVVVPRATVRQQQRPAERVERPRRPEPKPAPMRRMESAPPPVAANILPKSTPVVTKPPEPVAKFALDLTKRKQTIPIDVAPGRRLRIEAAGGSCEIAGDVPGVLSFGDEFHPRAEIELQERTEGAVIVITFVVDTVGGRPLPFTVSNLTNIRRRVARRASTAAATVASLEAEKMQIDAYLNSSRGKLVTTKRAAEARQAELPRLIAAAKAGSESANNELAAIERLLSKAMTASGSQVDVFVD